MSNTSVRASVTQRQAVRKSNYIYRLSFRESNSQIVWHQLGGTLNAGFGVVSNLLRSQSQSYLYIYLEEIAVNNGHWWHATPRLAAVGLKVST
jgi:hypothetical protein